MEKSVDPMPDEAAAATNKTMKKHSQFINDDNPSEEFKIDKKEKNYEVTITNKMMPSYGGSAAGFNQIAQPISKRFGIIINDPSEAEQIAITAPPPSTSSSSTLKTITVRMHGSTSTATTTLAMSTNPSTTMTPTSISHNNKPSMTVLKFNPKTTNVLQKQKLILSTSSTDPKKPIQTNDSIVVQQTPSPRPSTSNTTPLTKPRLLAPRAFYSNSKLKNLKTIMLKDATTESTTTTKHATSITITPKLSGNGVVVAGQKVPPAAAASASLQQQQQTGHRTNHPANLTTITPIVASASSTNSPIATTAGKLFVFNENKTAAIKSVVPNGTAAAPAANQQIDGHEPTPPSNGKQSIKLLPTFISLSPPPSMRLTKSISVPASSSSLSTVTQTATATSQQHGMVTVMPLVTTTPKQHQQFISITNGQLSNLNGPIKLLESAAGPPSATANTANKLKESPLKNRLLEALQRSPRMLNRSKSLTSTSSTTATATTNPSTTPTATTTTTKRKRARQRLPSEPIDLNSILGGMVKKFRESANEKQSSLLACTERMDECLSEKSKSQSPPDAKTDEANRKYTAADPDPIAVIKWHKSIGYVYKSRALHFRTNEFNLIETIDDADMIRGQIDAQFERNLNADAFNIITTSDLYNAARSDPKRKLRSKQQPPPPPTPPQTRSTIFPYSSPVRSLVHASVNPFSWDLYLKVYGGQKAPENLFINPWPSSANLFDVGMKLEAIDPDRESLFCVCTVMERRGYRVRLQYDGYPAKYSFWKNVDSMDIFPPGWCSRTGRTLQPPPPPTAAQCTTGGTFDWYRYLSATHALAAPRMYFTHLNASSSKAVNRVKNPFRIGWKLEAVDLKNSRKLCVASIVDVLDNRVLISFDGWDDVYDYWADISSPHIHPIGYHQHVGDGSIITPPQLPYIFTWSRYLHVTRSHAAPLHVFSTRAPMGFVVGQKLEIVDKENEILIRPATVTNVREYSIQVLFDGWPANYAYYVDDDHPDIHPIKWCQKTDHPLEPPTPAGGGGERLTFKAACGVVGCREIGNAKYRELRSHKSLAECPYESRNWANDHHDRLLRIDPATILRQPRQQRPSNNSSSNISSHRSPQQQHQSPQPQSNNVVVDAVAAAPPPLTREIKSEPITSSDENSSSSLTQILGGGENKPIECNSTNDDVTVNTAYQMKEETIVDVHPEVDNDEDDCDDNVPIIKMDNENSVDVGSENCYDNDEERYDTEGSKKRRRVSRGLLNDYGPSVREIHRLWQKNTQIMLSRRSKKANNVADNDDKKMVNPMCWTTTDVAEYVRALPNCDHVGDLFEKQDIDGMAFLSMSENDLDTLLNIKLGPAVKIYNQIVQLREEVNVNYMSSSAGDDKSCGGRSSVMTATVTI